MGYEFLTPEGRVINSMGRSPMLKTLNGATPYVKNIKWGNALR
jgi:hypothetical protein